MAKVQNTFRGLGPGLCEQEVKGDECSNIRYPLFQCKEPIMRPLVDLCAQPPLISLCRSKYHSGEKAIRESFINKSLTVRNPQPKPNKLAP